MFLINSYWTIIRTGRSKCCVSKMDKAVQPEARRVVCHSPSLKSNSKQVLQPEAFQHVILRSYDKNSAHCLWLYPSTLRRRLTDHPRPSILLSDMFQQIHSSTVSFVQWNRSIDQWTWRSAISSTPEHEYFFLQMLSVIVGIPYTANQSHTRTGSLHISAADNSQLLLLSLWSSTQSQRNLLSGLESWTDAPNQPTMEDSAATHTRGHRSLRRNTGWVAPILYHLALSLSQLEKPRVGEVAEVCFYNWLVDLLAASPANARNATFDQWTQTWRPVWGQFA